MADRVHPRDSPPSEPETAPSHHHNHNHNQEEKEEEEEVSTPRPSPPSPEKPVTPPGTYVIQIPKDQIYRVPPPENARRYQRLTNRKSRRSPCCCCLCSLLAILISIILLAGIAAAIFYFVVRPESPDYSIENIAIRGFNLTSSSPISPEFDVTVRANNPNDKIGIYYERKSSVNVFYEDVNLCDGVLPVFYQPSNNVTVFTTVLKGSGIELTSAVSTALLAAQNQGTVPFLVKLRAPIKIKVGSVKTWTITVKVDCDVTVDKLTAASKVVSKKCDYGVDLW